MRRKRIPAQQMLAVRPCGGLRMMTKEVQQGPCPCHAWPDQGGPRRTLRRSKKDLTRVSMDHLSLEASGLALLKSFLHCSQPWTCTLCQKTCLCIQPGLESKSGPKTESMGLKGTTRENEGDSMHLIVYDPTPIVPWSIPSKDNAVARHVPRLQVGHHLRTVRRCLERENRPDRDSKIATSQRHDEA